MNRARERIERASWLFGPALLAGVVLYAYLGIGWYFFDRFSLDLGSQHFPAYRELHQIVIHTVLGAPAAILLGLSIARVVTAFPRLGRALGAIVGAQDRTWIAFASLAALLVPVAIRMLVLADTAIVDDELIYRFEAELIARGHLTMPSPPLKLFFDQSYLINDGRMYGMYFVGWSALMAPGVWLGIDGYMNALYSALTVPPIFMILRELASSRWAKLGAVLYVVAPMIAIGAATSMSHTSGIFALAWMAYCLLRCEDERPRLAWHAGVAAFFSLAFFIRPTVAIGIGAPMLVVWALGLRRLLRTEGARADAARALALFGAIAIVLGGGFLAVNKAQTGSFFTTAYAREQTYAQENGLRFSMWGVPGMLEYLATDPVPHLQTHRSFLECMGEWGIAMLRLNYNTFGWPFSFAFAPFARGRWARMLAWMIATFSLVHFYVLAPGVDAYGPHHYIELALPILLLTILGAKQLTDVLAAWTRSDAPAEAALVRLPLGVMVAMIALCLVAYMPPRLVALASMIDNINEARDTLARQGVHHAVVFSARPFTSKFLGCAKDIAHHNVYWHPPNDPGLDADILWANHVSVKDDARLMKYFPDRRALVMVWLASCEARFLPLDKLKPGDVPDGNIGGNGKGLGDAEE
jgi:hypothetical protein